MKIVWNEQSFNWFSRASEYTGYNRALADILLKHLPCAVTAVRLTAAGIR